MFYAKKFLPKILVASLFLAVVVIGIFWNKFPKASAETNLPVTGYAWSDIIGWINFNPAFGGVSYNNTTGQLSGYAWSDNIGWVYFGPDKSNISASTAPNDPKQWAKANTTTGIVNGWAKTYRAIPDKTDINAEDGQTLGGWEGWIKMDHGMTNPVSIDFATGDFHGWAWSSDTAGIIGWISFNSKDCDLDNNGFIDIACGGNNNNTPAYPYKVTIGTSNSPTYTIEPASASVSVGGTQRFIGYYDSDGSGSAVKIDKTLEALSWTSNNALVSTIATSTGQAIANCLTAGTVAITSAYSNIPASASLTCTPVGGSSSSSSSSTGDGSSSSSSTGDGSSSSSSTGDGSSSSSSAGGTITITPSISTIKAVITEGLPANSETTTLTISSDCGNVILKSDFVGASINGTRSFSKNPVANEGTTVFSVKNIQGNTLEGTYPIKITGTADGCSDGVKTINLKVERIGSDWEEF